MQLATEMALASEGGSMGTWQNGSGPAFGQAEAHSTISALRAFQSSEHCSATDGNFCPHLNRGGTGVWRSAGTAEVTLLI